MHKHKEEIRDIYQGNNPDFEKDFTPQVAQELIEERQRDLRRSRLVSLAAGVLVIVLSVTLVSIVVHDVLTERSNPQQTVMEEASYIPRYTLPSDSVWVMDYQRAASQAELTAEPGPKPLSTQWVKNAAYHIIMGQQALAVNAHNQALEHFQRVVNIYPDIEGINRAVGMLYLQKQDYDSAIPHLEQALKEEEGFEVIVNLGAAYLGKEQYGKAEEQFKRALELQPENPGCHRNLAVLYREMKRENDAVFHFEKYLDMQPGDLDTMQTYALYLTKLGRWQEAAAFLTALTQQVTDVAPIYFLLAQVQVQNGNEQAAINALKRGVQLLDPQMALAWMNREEFDAVRNSGEFKSLVDRLEISTVSLEKPK
jgi:tetratricopeptide (TPR) repeat protein